MISIKGSSPAPSCLFPRTWYAVRVPHIASFSSDTIAATAACEVTAVPDLVRIRPLTRLPVTSVTSALIRACNVLVESGCPDWTARLVEVGCGLRHRIQAAESSKMNFNSSGAAFTLAITVTDESPLDFASAITSPVPTVTDDPTPIQRGSRRICRRTGRISPLTSTRPGVPLIQHSDSLQLRETSLLM